MTTSIIEIFEFPTLTKTTEPLRYSSLKTIKDELKTNAASINFDLGGGADGHLGLVLTLTEYTNVLVIPYVRHTNPPPLVIAPGTAQHEAVQRREEHREARLLFVEITNIEKS